MNSVLHEIIKYNPFSLYIKITTTKNKTKRTAGKVKYCHYTGLYFVANKGNSVALGPIVSIPPKEFFPSPRDWDKGEGFLLLKAQLASQRESSNKYHQCFKNVIAYVN